MASVTSISVVDRIICGLFGRFILIYVKFIKKTPFLDNVIQIDFLFVEKKLKRQQ